MQSKSKKFIHFLKQNNAYVRYVYNFGKHNYKLSFDAFTRVYLQSQYINSAFVWDETKEGWSYWNNLSERWRNLIMK